MTALAANLSRTFRHDTQQRFVVGASQEIFKGAAIGQRASDGKVYEWTGAAGEKFVGFAAEYIQTNSSGYRVRQGVPAGYNDSSTETPYVWVIGPDKIVQSVTIAGISAQTDQLEPVWMTDDNTFTLTPQADDPPVGYVLGNISVSGGTADLAVFNFDIMGVDLLPEGGWRKDTLVNGIGHVGISTTFVDQVTDLPLHGAGRISKLLFIFGRKSSGHTGALKFKLRLNNTFLKNTAGTFVFSVTTAYATVRGKVASVNIADSGTYSAKFGAGDLVRVRAQCATAPTGGEVTVVALSARRQVG